MIRTVRNLFKKTVLKKGNADWLSELQSVIEKYNNTIHNSNKLTLVQASKKSNERKVYSNLQDRKDRQQPKYKLGHLDRTSDIRSLFNKGDSTNYSYKLYTTTEVIHDTLPSIELTICLKDIIKIFYFLQH